MPGLWCLAGRCMRHNQKNISTSGAIPSMTRIGDPCMNAGMTFCWPMKNEPVAKNNAKHMRHKCRAIRAAPEIPPRRIMRRSPMAARVTIDPNT